MKKIYALNTIFICLVLVINIYFLKRQKNSEELVSSNWSKFNGHYNDLKKKSLQYKDENKYLQISSKYFIEDKSKLIESAILMSQINNSAQAYYDVFSYYSFYVLSNEYIKDSTVAYFAYYNASKALELGFDLPNNVREKIKVDSIHYYGSNYYLEKMKTKNN